MQNINCKFNLVPYLPDCYELGLGSEGNLEVMCILALSISICVLAVFDYLVLSYNILILLPCIAFAFASL